MNDPYSTPRTTIDPDLLADYNRGVQCARNAARSIVDPGLLTVPCGCGRRFVSKGGLNKHRARSGCKAVAK